MTDEELLEAFESRTLPPGEFTHTAHVRVAWRYLSDSPLPEALARFTAALQRFAAAHGAVGKYHATITTAYMLLIAERLKGARQLTWPEFAAANPDLLTRNPSVLSTYYSDAVLASEQARRTFVLPDGGSFPAARVSSRGRKG